jgi:HD-GYP domain-containing protein (c-di-GMP phosphodiesterase class II)
VVRGTYPLRVHLTTAMLLVVALVGALSAYHAYHSSSRLLLAASDETFAHIARETGAHLNGLLGPPRLQLELLARHPIAAAPDLAARLAAFPALAAALEGDPDLAAIHVGYDTGDYLAVRRQSDIGGAGGAATAFVVDSVERRPGREPAAVRLRLDREQRILGREALASPPDPRLQAWFYRSTAAAGLVRSDLYAEPGGAEINTAFSRRAPAAASVLRLDIALGELSRRLRELRVSPSAQIALIDLDGHVIAHPEPARLAPRPSGAHSRLASAFDLGQEALAEVYVESHGRDRRALVAADGRQWVGESRRLGGSSGAPALMLLAVPQDELLVGARGLARDQLLFSLLGALLALPLVWLLARALARPLERLAAQARAIRAFDFAPRPGLRSRIVEVDDLARATEEMRATIQEFLARSAALASEEHFERLLERVLGDTARAAHAVRGALYLLEEDGVTLKRAALHGADAEATFPAQLAAQAGHPVLAAAASGETQVAAERGGLCVGLTMRDGERVGVLALELAPRDLEGAGRVPLIAFIEALSGTAAVAIETRGLVRAQKALLESLIRIIANAIDAKSPYTGGHCQRVPALARMLAEAACAARAGPFAAFAMDESDWETLYVASWLHDCGKVTTPEYVVDKATKLETLHNRLHEVRMRFEVLKRDAEVACWRAVAEGADRAERQAELARVWRELDEEFAFIARCNIGGEATSAQDAERVRHIGSRTWLRTLDDRIGISEDERRRVAGIPGAPLPALERLLADKPEHRVARPPGENLPADNPWGFRLSPPADKYNRGEVHNLTIGRGTLTAEERYVINDHIVQTIVMLSQLPFPRHLRRVPEVAGGHHERMDGKGYPRGLLGADMSVLARIMAIADVYEALTASDRPYKSGKTVSESLRIMRRMAQERHIDADLYNLFVEAGVYHRYAREFLAADQIDEIDPVAARA